MSKSRSPEESEKQRKVNRWIVIRKEAEIVGLPVGKEYFNQKIPFEQREEMHNELQKRLLAKKEELGVTRVPIEKSVKQGEKYRAQGEARDNNLAHKELASRELARRSLLHYIERTHTDYEAGWVHEDICRRLEQFVRDVEARKSPRLMLFLPPRSGKSLIASTYFPSWVLGKHPEWEFIMASYSADLPIGFSRRVRNQLQTPEYKAVFPATEMSKDSTSAESWKTTLNGGLRAAGVGGGITGMGANCVVPYTQVHSRRGIIPISQVRVGEEIYAYDHERNTEVWARVRAVSCSRTTKSLICTGGVLSTPEHHFYVPDRGYVEAQYAQGLPLLRRKEIPTCTDVSKLHIGSSAEVSRISLRKLWQYVQKTGVGIREIEATVWGKHLNFLLCRLLQSLQKRTSDAIQQVSWGLPTLWSSSSRERPEEVLFMGMLCGVSERATGLCGVQRQLFSNKVYNSQTRQLFLSDMWQDNFSRTGTPYRSRYRESYKYQFNYTLPDLSQVVSHDIGAYAECFEECLKGEGETVVDIQTSTGNFFAGGVLIHNCFIIDDPVKDMQEADSLTTRDSVWEWYSSTAYTRLAPGGGMCVIQTRWNHDDLSGRLISKMNDAQKLYEAHLKEWEQLIKVAKTKSQFDEAYAVKKAIDEEYNSIDKWEIIEYQALATADEYLERSTGRIAKDEGQGNFSESEYQLLRRKGDALHESRFPRPLLLRYKQTMQPRHWAALYQQNPVPDEGLFFTKDLFRTRPHLPEVAELNCFAAWDLAIGSKNYNDYTVGVVGGIDADDNLWVLDMFRGRWSDLFKIANLIVDTHTRYRCVLTGIEKGQLELALMPVLARVMRERHTYITLAEGDSALRPVTDKMMRARPLQGRMQQGTVLFPQDVPWVELMRDEMLRFPAGTHDDIVDAMAWLVRMTVGQAPPLKASSAVLSSRLKSWKDRLNEFVGLAHDKPFMAR